MIFILSLLTFPSQGSRIHIPGLSVRGHGGYESLFQHLDNQRNFCKVGHFFRHVGVHHLRGGPVLPFQRWADHFWNYTGGGSLSNVDCLFYLHLGGNLYYKT